MTRNDPIHRLHFPVCFFTAVIFSVIAAQAEEKSGRGLFSSGGGIGAGYYFHTNVGESGKTLARFSVGLENKIGANLTDNLALIFYAGINFNDYKLAGDFAEWVFQDDKYLLVRSMFLMWFIPFAFFADSHAIVGPGLAYYLRPSAPCFFFEAGGGFSSFQSVRESDYVFGFGLFGGLGVEITEKIGFGLRVLWAPPSFQSEWTPSQGQIVNVLGTLNLR